MALFKIYRGNAENLPVALHDGYAYFVIDTGDFYIDAMSANNQLQRTLINPKAKRMTQAEIEEQASTIIKDGQIIIYPDNNIKIGDGVTTLANLPIISEGQTVTLGHGDLIGASDSTASATGAEIFNVYQGALKNVASGNYSHAEGLMTTASGYAAHAEGNTTSASGQYSHAEGCSAKATGNYSHAEGNSTSASGLYSHAEGHQTTASGDQSHAEGGNTTASGDCSHAEGANTTASGSYSHAEGQYTSAVAWAHAEGFKTTASGPYSHAQNEYTIANKEAQTAIGKFNIRDSSLSSAGQYAFIIGNGTSTASRSNAMTVDWNGNVAANNFTKLDGSPIIDTSSFALASTLSNYAPASTLSNYAPASTLSNYAPASTLSNYAVASTTLAGYGITDAYTKAETDAKITAVLRYKGIKATYAEVQALTDMESGDVWLVTENKKEYLYNGTAWEEFGPEVDMSAYATTASIQNFITTAALGHGDLIGASDEPGQGMTVGGQIFNIYEGQNKNVASGDHSHAEGGYIVLEDGYIGPELIADPQDLPAGTVLTNMASGVASHTEGLATTASGIASHTQGYETAASGNYSHAEGNATTASEIASHAQGLGTTASGIASHAEGNQTIAFGADSHAEGYRTTASGHNSHAEGNGTTASGLNSHAEGNNTTAYGVASHAEGMETVASGSASHAGGFATIAAKNSQTAIGKFNIQDADTSSVNGKYAFIIGNGVSTASRSNAMTVDWNGIVTAADFVKSDGSSIGGGLSREIYRIDVSAGASSGDYNIENIISGDTISYTLDNATTYTDPDDGRIFTVVTLISSTLGSEFLFKDKYAIITPVAYDDTRPFLTKAEESFFEKLVYTTIDDTTGQLKLYFSEYDPASAAPQALNYSLQLIQFV